ncbi:MAG TPA: caspase family protein [Anaerolineales bacterium]|nr:caspase family protein [Anaerolineales bacterium]
MPRTLYALLVGIDQYPPSVSSLAGCVNDVTAFHEWLKGRAAGGEFALDVRLLLSEQATRQAVIDGFRQHLAKAQAQDIALFYYSGHGSQEPAPAEFAQLELDALNETLVCWDSREPGGYDLADKELGVLLAEVASKGAHTVVILDSCHSGSGTRDVLPQPAVRWTARTDRPRPLDSFIFELDDARLARLAPDREANPSGWVGLPEGRHVLLAACQAHERAREYCADGKTWGAFSYFLRSTLEASRGVLSYRSLYTQARARVRAGVPAQSPQLEASPGVDVDQPFLGGAVVAHDRSYVAAYDSVEQAWILDAGTIHGIPDPYWSGSSNVALFPLGMASGELAQPDKAVAQAEVVQAGPQRSLLSITSGEDQLDTRQAYQAVLVALPLPPLGVRLRGEDAGLALLRDALDKAGPGESPSLYLREDDAAPQLLLLAQEGQYTIAHPADGRPMAARLPGYTAESARLAVQRMEHIARWKNSVDLQNPASNLPPDAVLFEILDAAGKPLPLDRLTFSYSFENGRWRYPSYIIRLKNQSDVTLYCGLLGLFESYAIQVLDPRQPVVCLEAGQEKKLSIDASVPDDVWKQGITDRLDVNKLVVCTEEFDVRLLEQGRLEAPKITHRSALRVPKNALGQLMRRIQNREGIARGAQSYSDWTTAQVALTVHRPLDTYAVPRSGTEGARLGSGVTVLPHPALEAQVRLGTTPPPSRDLAGPGLPPGLRELGPAVQSYAFQLTRSIEPPANMVELSAVADASVITPEAPLSLLIDTPLNPGEHVLAYGHDGEFYLPLGAVRNEQVGGARKARLDVQRLPLPTSLGSRDVVGSVRIYLQKVAGQPMGIPYTYPALTLAQPGAGNAVQYEGGLAAIRQRVAAAKRLTLFVHGLTGDSRGMVASSVHYLPPDEPVLALDFESINTSVQDTAKALKQRLEEIGLPPGHDKALRVVGHSLGGVVVRWLIEQEGGDKLFQKAILLGAPNAGTPWSTIQQYATVGLGLLLNTMTAAAWPLRSLSFLLAAFEKVDVTLDQLQGGSDLLKSLSASRDPHTPYTVVAGSTALKKSMEKPDEKARLGKFLTRLGYGGANLVAFFGQPNDIAVSVASALAVNPARDPAPGLVTLPCDHMTFFDSSASLELLAKELQ